ncbi:hypothetical protein KR222_008400 [Zaprionus bogoriensis]|nr:hypothetical protein KR222_008400 [Zaprionus bogoriensis]
MNSGYNPSVFHMPALAMESLCQQSMYQQHTYVDRNRMAVTDVIVQEHVSQSSWSMSAPTVSVPVPVRAPVFVQTGPYISSSAPSPPQQPAPSPTTPQSRYAYMSMPGVQYYATSSASMNAYGQMYMQHSSSSANMGAIYVPQTHATHARSQRLTKDIGTQTQSLGRRSSDAGSQTDVIGDAPPMAKFKLKAAATAASESSLDSHHSGSGHQVVQQGDRRNSQVSLPMQRLQDITRISLQGSDIAERLANAHRQRPCFKKMDTLCARLKQDLLRPDGVLPNINSQGIAWAVKDFIFVFTRIVNSWVILKGYVYNTPEGLNKIKDELPAGFMAAFDCWQISTLTLVEMIIKSFVNLDGMLQKQKTSFAKLDSSHNTWSSNSNSSDSNSSNKTLNGTDISLPVNTADTTLRGVGVGGTNACSTPHNAKKCAAGEPPTPSQSFSELQETAHESTLMDTTPMCSHNLNYLYTMIEDSEEAQRCVNANGTYLKTGTYTPLKKDANPEQTAPIAPKLPASGWNNSAPAVSVEQAGKSVLKCQVSKPAMKTQCRHNDVKPYTTPLGLVGREMARKLYELSNRIMQLQNIDRFFLKQFTRNYVRDMDMGLRLMMIETLLLSLQYPYFYERCQHEFIDVRAIILKCESATYQHIYQPIHDMRRIIYLVRNDLKDHTNMDLRLYTALYERSINEMLVKPPYLLHYFEHITGRPGESLISYEM